METHIDMKEHIIQTALQMVDNGFEIDVLTVRKIALKANVAVGSINYHFGSKDKLIFEVIDRIIDRTQLKETPSLMDTSLEPRDRLIGFLHEIVEIVMQFKEQSKMMLRYELLSDSFATPSHILGILGEIHPDWCEEDLKWLSILVVAPMQYIFIKENGFYAYTGSSDFTSRAFLDNHLKMLGI